MVRPTLECGGIVVSDRFADSSVAYQGAARGLGVSEVLSLIDTAIDGLWPDLTVLLRVDPEVGLRRADGEDRFEAEGLELQRAVAEAYEATAPAWSSRPGQGVEVDAGGSRRGGPRAGAGGRGRGPGQRCFSPGEAGALAESAGEKLTPRSPGYPLPRATRGRGGLDEALCAL